MTRSATSAGHSDFFRDLSFRSPPRITGSREPSPDDHPFAMEPFHSRRAPTYAPHGVVASSQPLTAQVGLQILKEGGNAVDAAIAMAAMANVTEPMMNGLWGDAFVMIFWEGKLHGLNASGRCGHDMTPRGPCRKLDQHICHGKYLGAGRAGRDIPTKYLRERGPVTASCPPWSSGMTICVFLSAASELTCNLKARFRSCSI